MKIPDIDQPVRLTWHYAAAYVLLAGPTLWLVRPWTWELPLISQVTGSVVLPAVVLVLVYFPPVFVASLIKSWTRQQKALERFILAFVVFLGAVSLTIVLGAGFISSLVTAVAAVGAHYLIRPKERKANQAAQTTPGLRPSVSDL